MKSIKLILLIFISFMLISCSKETATYEVTFLDIDGNIIEVKNVEEGTTVIPPIAPTIKYYNFIEWDQELTNIRQNITTQAIYEKSTEVYEMTDYNYWLRILNDKCDIDSPLMTKEEIDAYNKLIVNGYSDTNVVDVKSLDKKSNKNYVIEMINGYNKLNRYNIYNNETNKLITTEDKDNILNNRNLDNINSFIEVRYGIITDFAWLRAYPTNFYASSYSRDQFQETSLNVGEVIAIYHTSLDDNWYFVQATNYCGWIESKYVGICSYEEMVNFDNAENKLVVISDYVEINGSHVRMGQSFPLLASNEKYTILFPSRTLNGSAEFKTIEIAKTNDYSNGYLTYNYDNLYKQAFKLLDIEYSWGDKEKLGRDCSSTQNSIYACFGFKLPRNTSNQNSIPTYGEKLNNITISNIKQMYKPGTLIFSSGHVMMYIGETEDGIAHILHNTSAGDGKCIIQSISSYGINKIIGALKLQ